MKRRLGEDGPEPKRCCTSRFELSKKIPRGFLKSYRCHGEGADVTLFFNHIHPELVSLMRGELNEHQYKAVIVLNVEFTKEQPNGARTDAMPYFRSQPMRILHEGDIPPSISLANDQLIKKLEEWVHNGSGWMVSKIVSVNLDVAAYVPLSGSSYVDLPPYLKNKKAIINVQNADNQCLR